MKCGLMRQQLKKIAGLYLRADINEIKKAIKKFGLDELIVTYPQIVISEQVSFCQDPAGPVCCFGDLTYLEKFALQVDFMSKQCSASTDLKALSLQMSCAFARDALASAANHHFSKQLSRQGPTTPQPMNAMAAPPFLHTSAIDTSISAGSRAWGAAGGSAKQPREFGFRSEAAQLGLVSALSFHQEGSIGGSSDGGEFGNGSEAPAETPVHHSSSQGSLQEPQSLVPSPADVLRAQADLFLTGTPTAKPGMQFLEKFGSRTILTYLMRVRDFNSHLKIVPHASGSPLNQVQAQAPRFWGQ